MKIVQAHNFYMLPGGEDTVVRSERMMLSENGHEVIEYYIYNEDINSYSLPEKLKLFSHLHFNTNSFKKCVDFLRLHQPDICHVHNTFHIISAAIYKACLELDIPVVQTLHNYRSICANGMFTRNDEPCEDCLGKSAHSAILKKCYRQSLLQTAAVTRMIEKNKKKQVWKKEVDAFICLTEFAKSKFIDGGLPKSKIHIKPNFVKPVLSFKPKEDFLIYVGRLDRLKGAHLLAEIAANLRFPIVVIGKGPLSVQLAKISNIRVLGKKSHDETLAYIQKAKALILPSIVYEGMPMTLLESFALKTPVIASNIGAMASIITNNTSGVLFKPNDSNDAVEKIDLLLDNQVLLEAVCENAFKEYQLKYSEKANLESLVSIYNSVLN